MKTTLILLLVCLCGCSKPQPKPSIIIDTYNTGVSSGATLFANKIMKRMIAEQNFNIPLSPEDCETIKSNVIAELHFQ